MRLNRTSGVLPINSSAPPENIGAFMIAKAITEPGLRLQSYLNFGDSHHNLEIPMSNDRL